MKMRKYKVKNKLSIGLVSLLLILGLISCENTKDKKIFGQLIGAAVGGYVGSKIGSGVSQDIAVILGSATGYILGGKIVELLEAEDREEFNNVIEDSLNNNSDNISTTWESKNSNKTKGSITPLNNYSIDQKSCRDFKKIIKKNKKVYEEESTACRDEKGNWVLI